MLGKASERRHKVELGHLDYIMQGKYEGNVCKMKLPRGNETRLDHEKEQKKLELEP